MRRLSLFQSRYRAASHFRVRRAACQLNPLQVSISLSSGFSFQVVNLSQSQRETIVAFQSRYRAASHFRDRRGRGLGACMVVSISLSSGFSFQVGNRRARRVNLFVSISLSSGFSFQVRRSQLTLLQFRCFNLVIERLLISGYTGGDTWDVDTYLRVSISLSSGFSFQVNGHAVCERVSKFQSRYRAASHFRSSRKPSRDICCNSFNLVIERLLISGDNCLLRVAAQHCGFNLVIERLLISGF